MPTHIPHNLVTARKRGQGVPHLRLVKPVLGDRELDEIFEVEPEPSPAGVPDAHLRPPGQGVQPAPQPKFGRVVGGHAVAGQEPRRPGVVCSPDSETNRLGENHAMASKNEMAVARIGPWSSSTNPRFIGWYGVTRDGSGLAVTSNDVRS